MVAPVGLVVLTLSGCLLTSPLDDVADDDSNGGGGAGTSGAGIALGSVLSTRPGSGGASPMGAGGMPGSLGGSPEGAGGSLVLGSGGSSVGAGRIPSCTGAAVAAGSEVPPLDVWCPDPIAAWECNNPYRNSWTNPTGECPPEMVDDDPQFTVSRMVAEGCSIETTELPNACAYEEWQECFITVDVDGVPEDVLAEVVLSLRQVAPGEPITGHADVFFDFLTSDVSCSGGNDLTLTLLSGSPAL
jgi:hypothetical protein